jgi:hypothetical protein
MFMERVDVDDPRYRLHARLRQLKLIGEPSYGNTTVCIGIRKPYAGRSSLPASESGSGSGCARIPNPSRVTPHNAPGIAQHLARDSVRSIFRTIDRNHDIA